MTTTLKNSAVTELVGSDYHEAVTGDSTYLPAGALLNPVTCQLCQQVVDGTEENPVFSDGRGYLYCEECSGELLECEPCRKSFPEDEVNRREEGEVYCSSDCLETLYEWDAVRRDDEAARVRYLYS
jgi:hypothetical protein